MSAQTIDFQTDPARTANLASFRSTHRRKLLRRALPPAPRLASLAPAGLLSLIDSIGGNTTDL